MNGSGKFPRPTEAQFAAAAARSDEERFKRRASNQGRIKALSALHDTLVNYGQLFESDDLQDKRDAVSHALIAVADYLDSQGFSPFITAPLLRPAIAIAEREHNSIDAMFSQRPRGGRPKTELKQHERTGILAALADGWLQTHQDDGTPHKAKLQAAARHMKGRWFGTVTRAQLEAARELVSQEASDHPAVGSARATSKIFLQALDVWGQDAAFEVVVRMFNDMKLPMGAGEGGISKTPPVSPGGKS